MNDPRRISVATGSVFEPYEVIIEALLRLVDDEQLASIPDCYDPWTTPPMFTELTDEAISELVFAIPSGGRLGAELDRRMAIYAAWLADPDHEWPS